MGRFLESAAKTGIGSSPRDMVRVREWIKKEPQDPQPYAVLGSIHAARKEYDKACAFWIEAIRRWRGKNALGVASLREQIASTRLLLGQRRQAMREYAYAAQAFRRGRGQRLAAIIKDDSRVREADCLARLGRLVQAARLLRHVQRGANRETFEESIQEIAQRFPDLPVESR